MKRSMCGLVLLTAAFGLASCGGDPTKDSIQEGEQVVADPSSVFVDAGSSKFVNVQLLDVLGNAQAADFEAQNPTSGITVEKDTTYLQTTIGTHLQTGARFLVTGVTPGAASFDIVSSGQTTTIPVKVVPTSFAATISNPAPAVNEEVTITLPAGYTFAAGASISTDKGTGVVRSFAPDSTNISAIIPPGSSGAVTIDSVHVDFLPGVTLAGLPTEATVTADSTPLPGTAAPGTAPTMPVPALDANTAFMDVGAFTAADITGDGGIGAQYYKLVVTQAGDYTFTTSWDGVSDLDPVLCHDTGCAVSDFAGTGSDNPEVATLTLAPGTYYLGVVLFGGAAPATFSVQISAAATPPPPPPAPQP
jgi:hypothetical protein